MNANNDAQQTAPLLERSRPADRLCDFKGDSTAGEFDIAQEAVIESAEKTAPRSVTGALDDPDGQEENGARYQRD